MKNNNILFRQPVYEYYDNPESEFQRWYFWGQSQAAKYTEVWSDNIESQIWAGAGDINGKHIFEGDILRYPGTTTAMWIVAFSSTRMQIEAIPINKSYRHLRVGDLNLLEIIGNIIENPELINENT